MISTMLENVRKNKPLIHNITNYVTVNDVANVLLACGASPIMADDPDEVEDITAICSGLNINIGTLNKRTIESMIKAGKKSAELGHVTTLDPVGAGASALRTETAREILKKVPLTAVRGNISEIKTLAIGSATTQGVDANEMDAVTEENLERAIAFIKEIALRWGIIVAVTGAIDLVTDGRKCYVIRNGEKEMSSVTGTGCQLSGLIPAFIAANPEEPLKATAAAVITMGIAGETAKKRMEPGDGNFAYRGKIIDAVCNITPEKLEKEANYEIK